MKINQTICALATPPLLSALAIIRVSGKEAFSIVSKSSNKSLTGITERKIINAQIKDSTQIIDDVVLLVYKGPKSFTGEDVVEIISHGSSLITREILDLLIKNGCRMAQHGEYSMRGYLNNKFDLIQAEAINDMIHSTTKEAKNLSILSMEGETSALILPYKDLIAALLASIEVSIDFPEYEDIEEKSHDDIKKEISLILKGIKELIKNGAEGQIIKEGVRIALIGKPNSGKSSLLNAILNEDKAIVTDIAGTTRDIVEGEIVYKGIPFQFFDTAGIRKSNDKIERIGIQKTMEIINNVDFVVCLLEPNETVIDASEIKGISESKLIVVNNKSDLISKKKEEHIYISAIKKEISPLLEALLNKLNINETSFTRPSFNNERQLTKLKRVYALLEETLSMNEEKLSLDLISVPLQSAYQEIIELLGGQYNQDLSEEIFSRFCVGK